MEYAKLGCSQIEVSKVCLGCMSFGKVKGFMHEGWALDEADSTKIISYAYEKGINFFDTAMIYANGESEKIVGKALKSIAPRDKVVVATKFMPLTKAELDAGVSSKDHVRNNLDASLKRLDMDYVDLYICHMWDFSADMYMVYEAMAEAVKEGKVRAIGMSNCMTYQLAKLSAFAKERGLPQISSYQGHYNLMFREEEREMVPFCEEENIALTPYSPLAAGRLAKDPGVITDRLNTDITARAKYDENQHTKACDNEIIKRVGEIANKYVVSRSEVALNWLMRKTASPVAGATKFKHIDDAISAVNLKLAAEDMQYLEAPYVAHDLVGVMKNNRPGVNFNDVVGKK